MPTSGWKPARILASASSSSPQSEKLGSSPYFARYSPYISGTSYPPQVYTVGWSSAAARAGRDTSGVATRARPTEASPLWKSRRLNRPSFMSSTNF